MIDRIPITDHYVCMFVAALGGFLLALGLTIHKWKDGQ